jgi:hypothetical protein
LVIGGTGAASRPNVTKEERMTNAQLAAKLLREAASFYRILSDGKDAQTSERIEKFGRLYEQVADKVEVDPQSEVEADTLT